MKVLKPGGSADGGEVLEAMLGKGALEVTPEGGRAPQAAPLLRDIAGAAAVASSSGSGRSSAADDRGGERKSSRERGKGQQQQQRA